MRVEAFIVQDFVGFQGLFSRGDHVSQLVLRMSEPLAGTSGMFNTRVSDVSGSRSDSARLRCRL